MTDKRKLYVEDEGVLRLADGTPARGMFTALHQYATVFDVFIVPSARTWQELAGWLNDWEAGWRSALSAAGAWAGGPPQMLAARVRFAPHAPAGEFLLSRRALTHSGEFLPLASLVAFSGIN